MRRLAEAGKFHGGPRPIGLNCVEGGLRAVASEQALVRRIDAELTGPSGATSPRLRDVPANEKAQH
jgi:hypothetical protein